MTTTRRYPAATKDRRPTPLGLREAVQKKPHIELHSSTTHYAKLSLAGEVGASGRCEASSRAPGEGFLHLGIVPLRKHPLPNPLPQAGEGAHLRRWNDQASFHRALEPCDLRIHGDNLQPGCVQRFGDLLGQQLGFFSSDLIVRKALEERANRRCYDGIDLVRINHFGARKIASPARRCIRLQDCRAHRKPKNERMAAITTMSPMR
nr:hypothetical protein BDOA9_0129180 [Bradyrhizobium sp. DOA9]